MESRFGLRYLVLGASGRYEVCNFWCLYVGTSYISNVKIKKNFLRFNITSASLVLSNSKCSKLFA